MVSPATYVLSSACGTACVVYPAPACTFENPFAGCSHRKLKISKKVGDYLLIGVSAPGIKADSTGHTCRDPSSFCIRSNGVVYIAGEMISKDAFPPTSITQPDLFAQRGAYDKLFTEGDEVAVTVNCHSHKLRLQTPTVDHAISLPKKSFWQSDKQWVLNVNFWTGDFEVKLM